MFTDEQNIRTKLKKHCQTYIDVVSGLRHFTYLVLENESNFLIYRVDMGFQKG